MLSCSSSGNEMQEMCFRYNSKTVNKHVKYALLKMGILIVSVNIFFF
jgi:hypothetical protein